MSFLVAAAYKFFDLKDREAIRFPLRDFCRDRAMKGTILLSEEGVNLNISGTRDIVAEFKKYIVNDLGWPEFEYKEHESQRQPFKRMLVKLKKEIISMGMPDVKPSVFTGPNLSPVEFKKWLDEKRDITILDTRNDYEVEVGKFNGAIDLNVESFREFAQRAKELPQELKEKPMVMYCTGGIRCEKASALFIQKYGFKEVYQLRGGILQYFKDVGSSHYDGECWVYDQRETLDADENEKFTQSN